MNKTVLLWLGLMLSGHSQALGRVVSYDEIRGPLFATIRSITLCGAYRADAVAGEVRLIETFTYGGNMIFLDTIQLGSSGLELRHGVSIQETNNDHAEWVIEQVACRDLGNNQITIEGQVSGSGHDDDLRFGFTVRYDAHTGAYSYQQTPAVIQPSGRE